jgi:hypothetical protein
VWTVLEAFYLAVLIQGALGLRRHRAAEARA